MGIVFVFVSELLALVLDLRSRFSNKTILALEEKWLLLQSHHWKASWGKVECHSHHHPHHPEVEFVHAVTAGGSVKFLPAV